MKRKGNQRLAHPDFPDEWTLADCDAACAEGWSIYKAHGALEIERNDVNDPPHENAPEWDSDDAAIEFIKAKASEGSERHQRALAIHEKYAEEIRATAFAAYAD